MTAIDQDPALVAFREDAAAFCDFIDQFRGERITEPYTKLLPLLSNLARSAATIPFDMPEEDREDDQAIDTQSRQRISREIDAATSAVRRELMAYHAGDDSARSRAFMLWDDLSDLYLDLREGLTLYARGNMAEAVWQWHWGYEHHWGSHLLRALLTVHEIRYALHNQ